jgi:quinol monooxygenase YgiN
VEPITLINFLSIKAGKLDEFIDSQRGIASTIPEGLLGGRLYRGADGKTAVLISQFVSKSAQEKILQTSAFKEHIDKLRELVDSSRPAVYEEVYTYGQFK